MKETKVVAEIGTSHGGDIEKAFAMIDEAKDAGAHVVKFQWVYADEILHPDTGFVNLPGGAVRLYDRFRSLEVDPSFFERCCSYSHERGLLFACSPFGLRSLHELVEIKPDAIKIASPEVNHIPLLLECAKYYGKIPIILSSGVSKIGDIEKAIDILTGGHDEKNPPEDISVQGKYFPPLTLLHCITFYPAPENEYNVRCVDTLGKIFGIPTGISDHSLDPVLVPALTVAMGGSMIEKHITISKKTDGLDDPVALEGEDFARMCLAVSQSDTVLNRYERDFLASKSFHAEKLANGLVVDSGQAEIIRQMCISYGEKKVMEVLGSGVKRLAKIEMQNYGRTNRSLHYTRDMKAGETVGADDVSVLRTEKILTPGIAPDFLETVLGARLEKNVSSGAGVCFSDFINKK